MLVSYPLERDGTLGGKGGKSETVGEKECINRRLTDLLGRSLGRLLGCLMGLQRSVLTPILACVQTLAAAAVANTQEPRLELSVTTLPSEVKTQGFRWCVAAKVAEMC